MASPSLLRRSWSFVAVAACGAALLASCLRTESYVYFAQRYEPTNDCLEKYSPVEVVNGAGAGSCAAMCMTVGADLFVSKVCPPLPAIATEVPADAGDCIAALKAAKRGGTCDAPPDGGADADADAEADAGSDGGGQPDAEADAADANMPIVDAGDAG